MATVSVLLILALSMAILAVPGEASGIDPTERDYIIRGIVRWTDEERNVGSIVINETGILIIENCTIKFNNTAPDSGIINHGLLIMNDTETFSLNHTYVGYVFKSYGPCVLNNNLINRPRSVEMFNNSVKLEGNEVQQPGVDGFYFKGTGNSTSRPKIQNNVVQASGNNGFRFLNVEADLYQNRVINVLGDAFYIQSSNITLTGTFIEDVGRFGVTLIGRSHLTIHQETNITASDINIMDPKTSTVTIYELDKIITLPAEPIDTSTPLLSREMRFGIVSVSLVFAIVLGITQYKRYQGDKKKRLLKRGLVDIGDAGKLAIDGTEEIKDGGRGVQEELGDMAMESGSYKRAIEHYNRALRLNERVDILMVKKGQALNQLGKKDAAFELFVEALKINESNAEAMAGIKEFEGLLTLMGEEQEEEDKDDIFTSEEGMVDPGDGGQGVEDKEDPNIPIGDTRSIPTDDTGSISGTDPGDLSGQQGGTTTLEDVGEGGGELSGSVGPQPQEAEPTTHSPSPELSPADQPRSPSQSPEDIPHDSPERSEDHQDGSGDDPFADPFWKEPEDPAGSVEEQERLREIERERELQIKEEEMIRKLQREKETRIQEEKERKIKREKEQREKAEQERKLREQAEARKQAEIEKKIKKDQEFREKIQQKRLEHETRIMEKEELARRVKESGDLRDLEGLVRDPPGVKERSAPQGPSPAGGRRRGEKEDIFGEFEKEKALPTREDRMNKIDSEWDIWEIEERDRAVKREKEVRKWEDRERSSFVEGKPDTEMERGVPRGKEDIFGSPDRPDRMRSMEGLLKVEEERERLNDRERMKNREDHLRMGSEKERTREREDLLKARGNQRKKSEMDDLLMARERMPKSETSRQSSRPRERAGKGPQRREREDLLSMVGTDRPGERTRRKTERSFEVKRDVPEKAKTPDTDAMKKVRAIPAPIPPAHAKKQARKSRGFHAVAGKGVKPKILTERSPSSSSSPSSTTPMSSSSTPYSSPSISSSSSSPSVAPSSSSPSSSSSAPYSSPPRSPSPPSHASSSARYSSPSISSPSRTSSSPPSPPSKSISSPSREVIHTSPRPTATTQDRPASRVGDRTTDTPSIREKRKKKMDPDAMALIESLYPDSTDTKPPEGETINHELDDWMSWKKTQ